MNEPPTPPPTLNEPVETNHPIKIKDIRVTWDVLNVELDGNLESDLRLGIRRKRKSNLGTVQKWTTFSKTGESKLAIPFHAYADYDYEIVNADLLVQFTFKPLAEDLTEDLWREDIDDQDLIKKAKKLISDGKKFDSSEKKIDDVYKLAEVSFRRQVQCRRSKGIKAAGLNAHHKFLPFELFTFVDRPL